MRAVTFNDFQNITKRKPTQKLVGNDTAKCTLSQIVPVLGPFEYWTLCGGGHFGFEPKKRLSNGGIMVDYFFVVRCKITLPISVEKTLLTILSNL